MLLLTIPILLGGCIQDGVVTPTSAIQARITVPFPLSTVGIRANLVGSGTNINRVELLGPFPATSDLGFCDVEGDFNIVTRHTGRQFVVARGQDYDIGWGIVDVPEAGKTITQFEVNLDSGRFGPTDPILTDSLHQLIPKTAATAVFLLFEADFGALSSVDVVGDFNDFNPQDGARPLFDDGSQFDIDPATAGIQLSGDRIAGDGVWSRIDQSLSSFSGDTLKYGFIINKDEVIRRDPYEELSDDDRSAIVIK